MPPATDMQEMEMEMVEGMYDTFELLSSDPPSYAVLLAASADDPPELKVTVTYPTEDYPETASCTVAIECIAKNRRILTQNISKEVASNCEENMGVHVVIMALQQIQEFLSNWAQEAEKAELVRRGEAQAEAAAKIYGVKDDPTIRIGTAVTRELFAEWSKKHQAVKMKVRAERDKAQQRVSASKLSGRQLWDSTLRSADWELFGGAGSGNEEDAGEDVDFDALQDLDENDFDFDDDDN